MIEKKKNLLILFGGESPEHEVSVASAKNIFQWACKEKYTVRLVYISCEGQWYTPLSFDKLQGAKIELQTALEEVDVAFPVFHGSLGEDGTIQGLLKFLGIPFVGSDVLSTSVCMDKEYTKRLLAQASLPIGRFIAISAKEKGNHSFSSLAEELGSTFFIKPARAGSSVGLAKVDTEESFIKAYEEAFFYDDKVLVEELTPGRDIECCILGNEEKRASLPGEIICVDGFYSYEAKCIDTSKAELVVPAVLAPDLTGEIQNLAILVANALGCEGMARVDFLLTEKGELFVNEVNTIPGCTETSLFPRLWECSGICQKDLVDEMIALAFARHEKKKQHIANAGLTTIERV